MLHSSERGRIPGYRLGANTMKLIWLSAIALGLSACCTHPQNSAPSDQAPKAKAAKPDAQAMAAGHAKAKPMPASKIAGVSRSEERRVGKECRSRWARETYKESTQ